MDDLYQTPSELLALPKRHVFEWRIGKAKRQHVHRWIDDAELPVRHDSLPLTWFG